MRRPIATLLLSLGLAAPAFADTMGVLRENTLLLHEASGRFYTLLISDGGKMEQVNSAGIWASGFWSVQDDGRFCWTARGAATLCIVMPVDKGVGDTWEITGPTGRLVWTAEIREGRASLSTGDAASAGEDSSQ